MVVLVVLAMGVGSLVQRVEVEEANAKELSSEQVVQLDRDWRRLAARRRRAQIHSRKRRYPRTRRWKKGVAFARPKKAKAVHNKSPRS